MKNEITFVTALFDIGRDKLSSDFSREFGHYLQCFKRLLDMDLKLVVFCDENVEKFINENKKSSNVVTIRKTLDDIRNFPFFQRVQAIRNDEKWLSQSGWLAHSPQAALELYNPIVMSKQFFLHDASIFNFFGTRFFAWIDAGIANTLNIETYLNKENLQKLTREFGNKMTYIAFPYDGNVEVHGFAKDAINRYCGTNSEYVVRGGFFGGTKEIISCVNDIYYSLLHDTLNSGYMGTEESLFTIISYMHPDKVNLNMIDSNGLIYKFFEQIKSKNYDPILEGDGTIAIYALTFNLPKQFKLWAESFEKAYPDEFKTYKKYVFNNSTDPAVAEEYNELFRKYDFEEFKYNNIGINDARFEVAKHFASSTHQYMIFFEDDMLLHDQNSGYSKLGFPTYYKNIFDICSEILTIEKLDYIKLSFDEFYGNNLENWGWYNLPTAEKQKYFPDGDRKTKISHIGSFKGVPYAVGEYHYCNWPIMFNKEGNRKIFLETEYAYKFEQTWMSMVCSMQKENKIKAASLLASIINHNRVYHYPKEKRKENNSY